MGCTAIYHDIVASRVQIFTVLTVAFPSAGAAGIGAGDAGGDEGLHGQAAPRLYQGVRRPQRVAARGLGPAAPHRLSLREKTHPTRTQP